MLCPSRKDKHLLPTILSASQASAPGLLSSPRKPSPSPPRGPASWLLEMGPQTQSVQSTSVGWLVAHRATEWSEHRETPRVDSLLGKQQNHQMPLPLRTLPTWECQNTADLDVGLLGAETCTSEVQLGNVVTPKTSEYDPPFFIFFGNKVLTEDSLLRSFLQQSPLGCGP